MPLKILTGSSRLPPCLRRQLVREVRQRLAAVLGDEHQVLQPHTAVALAVGARLERDDVAHDQLVTRAAEPRLLVHVEADAVAQTVEEPIAEDLPVRLRPLCRNAGLLVDLARDVVDLATMRARTDGCARRLERLLCQPVPLGELAGDLADRERARHVRIARRLVVDRPDVDDDRRALTQGAGARVVTDSARGTRGDDDIRRQRRTVLAADRDHLVPDRLARQLPTAAQQFRSASHGGIRGSLSTPDPSPPPPPPPRAPVPRRGPWGHPRRLAHPGPRPARRVFCPAGDERTLRGRRAPRRHATAADPRAPPGTPPAPRHPGAPASPP